MPALHHRLEPILHFTLHVKDAGRARAEHPLVRVGGEEIHVLHRRRERAHRLDAIDTKQDAPRTQLAADRVDVDPVAGHVMARGQRRHAGARVDQRKHVLRLDPAGCARLEPLQLDALFGQGHPRVNV